MGKLVWIFSCLLISHCVWAQKPQAVEVKVLKTGGSFQLLRGGKPYYIKGGGGYDHYDLLKDCGGNSIRIWDHDRAKAILDQAEKLGLTVMVGLWVGHERHGFDYDNKNLVERQLEMFRKIVLELKDHPALLCWGVGNEVNLFYKNKKVWDALNGLGKMIHETDTNHPTVAVIAGANQEDVALIKSRCPHIDILGINSYGAVNSVPEDLKRAGWDRPYIITEWGPTGHWECAKTQWGAAIEPSSTLKAEVCKSRYEKTMLRDKEHCLGSYIFIWGSKQEVTATWYSSILETGEETETVEVMRALWGGKLSGNAVPRISNLVLDTHQASENIQLYKKENYTAQASAHDEDKDTLRYMWEIMKEARYLKAGGDQEDTPSRVFYSTSGNSNVFTFTAPRKKGYYRLFVYVFDGHKHVATQNIPFEVRTH
jgi:hypothetical protein